MKYMLLMVLPAYNYGAYVDIPEADDDYKRIDS